jgi:hypothetical protein
MTMVNNVIGVVNYVIAARPSLLNFMIADTTHWMSSAEPANGPLPRVPLVSVQAGGAIGRWDTAVGA